MSNEVITPARFLRLDTCRNCLTPRSIELYNRYNKPIMYSSLIDRLEYGSKLDDLLKKNELSHFKCRRCGKVYDIFWNIDKGIPEPLSNENTMMYFLDHYKK